jgi:hypothetical protein
MLAHAALPIAALALAIAGSGVAQRAAAQAQPSTYDDLVKAGEAAVIGADWDACLKYFAQAHRIRPSEVTFLAIGRCALERGNYVEALRHLQEGMRYSLTERQRVSVENLKARALQHLGRYRLALYPAHAVVTIGGERAVADAQGYVWLEAGRYPVQVAANGHDSMSGELVVEPGDDGTISYSLAPIAPQAPLADPGATPSSRAGDGGDFPVLPVVLMSAGGALLIGSLVTGVLALGEKSDLDDRCTLGPLGNQCDPSLQGKRDDAQTLALVTDVLWISGAAVAGTGLVLLLVQAGGDDEPPAAVQIGAAPTRGGGVLQIGGRF